MRAPPTAVWGFCVLVSVSTVSSADVDVVVNEVLYHPPDAIATAEFIELHNRGADPVDLAGWKVAGGISFTIPSGTVIAPDGFVLVVKDLGLASWLYPGVRLVGSYSGSLSNSSDRIRLLNPQGVLIDEVEYSDDDGWPREPDGNGASLEKVSPELDPWLARSWGPSVTLLGTPGRTNTQVRGTKVLDWVVAGEDWRYLKGTDEPPADWASLSFDASAWLEGPTGIGYGDDDDATVLDDMLNGYSSVYLRKTFRVVDPSTVTALTLLVDYDDGFIAYLNGVEVARRAVGGTPGVPLGHDALAAVSHEAGVVEPIDLGADRSLLVAGTNVLAIHALNLTLDSTDFSMIPALEAEAELVGGELSLSRLAPVTVIPRSSTWSYFKGTGEPSETAGEWTTAGFDDSAWLVGTAGFGFSDNDDATILSDMLGRYSTVYVRKRFALADVSTLAGMVLGVDIDDGFVAYLNGVEVARAYAPGTVGELLAYSRTASASHEAGTELTFDIGSRLDLLVEGENVLAIQGLNAGISNGDFSLHPRLTLLQAVAADPASLRTRVSIHEISVPDGAPGWIELWNGSPDPVDISGYGLGNDPADPLRYTLPEGTTLEPGAYVVVPEMMLGFDLAAEGVLLLTDPQGVILIDGKRYEIPDLAYSAGAWPDGDGDFAILASPTPGAPNVAPPDRGVIINEIMYHPVAAVGETELEWIELHNRTAASVDLTGWALTRGISWDLPAGAQIAAGGYLVIAREPARVAAAYGISGVVGGYTSGLRNDDEVILLRDELGNEADRVHYADDGRWPEAADGGGPSLELLHPDLDNHTGQAWAASAGAGTPGASNSVWTTDVPPIVIRVEHFPLVPRDGQPVTVTAEVGGLAPAAEVRLYWRAAGSASFEEAPMLDDGLSGDGAAGDGVHAAAIPGQPDHTVVEFFVEAEGATGLVRLVPPSAPDRCNLYLVDEPPADRGVPLYRIVMTPADRQELETRDVYSDVGLNATFIAGDKAWYAVSVRYRGESSRLVTPKSYRVDFTDDEELDGIKHLNLNANNPQHQHLGMRLFRGSDVPASLTEVVRLAFCDAADRTYTRMEEVGEDFLRRYYTRPDGEDDGDLYRGLDNGNLDYRGTDEESYRPSYKKETDEFEDDWSALIELCDVLTNTPDAQLPTVLPTIIDVDEWVRFFAAHTLISTQEGGIYRDKGDDYFLYRRPSDGRWVLIPWDIDDSFRQPTERLFRPTLASIRKILLHPDWTTSYYSWLVRLSSTHISEDRFREEQALLTGLVSQATLDADLAFVQNRLAFVDTGTNQAFSVELRAETLVAKGAAWKFFRGTAEPSGGTLDWAAPSFDDAAWESGPSGLGYGDNDDATVLADMLGGYTTVYARHAFEVPDPSRYPALELAIDYDDGFVAFLNGTEIARSNAGPAGTYPTFDAVASGLREAGSYQNFEIPAISSLLVPGTNVLAVVVLNASLDSTDVSLIPELRTGGVVGEGCPGEKYMTGSLLYLAGSAPVTQTRWVRVNGVDASYDRFTGLWSYATPLSPQSQAISVQVLDKLLSPVATESFSVTRVTTVGGSVSEDTVWTSARSPYLVTGSVSVPSGIRLTIEPGCRFLISEGVGFDIGGEIQALGTAAAPILFTSVPCHSNWGWFNIHTRGSNRFERCELSRSTATAGCLTVSSSNLEIEGCHIHDITGEGVSASGSTVTIRNTIVERTAECLSLDYGLTTVEYCTLRNGIGKADLCDANGSNNPPARIAFNTMYGTSDDAIDADKGSVYAEGNIIHDCGDQGISLVGTPGNSTVYRNVVYRNNVGLSAKDSHVALVDFNTFAYNRSIGVRGIQKNGGLGGGKITLKNSIVWGSPTSLFVDYGGVITTTYSDVQGTEPPPGIGNINLDPLWVNAPANDYRLTSSSPCIGAAEGGDDMGAIPFELAPRAPTQLAVSGTTLNSVSLAWRDNSFAESSYELERRVSIGFVPVYLVRKGDAWRYFRGQSEPSAGTQDWTGIAFDDSSWSSGPTGIGYGDGDDATVLSDMQNRYSTVYLRKTFDVADPSGITALELLVDYDDGFIAFLNGTEVARSGGGDPGTYPPYNGFSGQDHEAGSQETFEVPVAGLLVAGTNVLAIHGLNATLGSTDFSIIPELRTVDETPFSLLANLPANTRTHVDQGLVQAARYSYRVRAVNAIGASAWSNIVSIVTGTIPAAPSDLSVLDVDDSSITLAWTDNATTEEGQQLERAIGEADFELLAALPANAISYVDSSVTEGETYSYRVRATNVFGASGYSNVVTQTAGLPPEAPTDLAVGAVTLDTIELSWTDASDDETSFELEISLDGSAFHPRAVLPEGTTTHLDTELGQGVTYWYRVRATSAVGPSGYSNVVSATTGSLPDAPLDLTVTDIALDAIVLAWVDASDDEQAFELERKGEQDAEFTLLATLGEGSTSHRDESLPQGARYEYRVRAVNEWGPSAYSNAVSATTGRLPAAPGGLIVGSVGLEEIHLSWLDSADNETGFELERSESGGPFVGIVQLPADATAHVDLGLTQGTEYAYRVRAFNAYGPSEWSPTATATTERLPARPTGLTLTFRGHDAIAFSWTDNADNETGFAIERGDEGGAFREVAQISENGTSFHDQGLEQGTDYAYRVFALCAFGRSEPSEVLEATTGRFPDAPSGLGASAEWLDTIRISWTDNADNESGFEVERKTGQGGAFLRVAAPGENETSFVDTGLDAGKTYAYRVRSVNEFGTSAWSGEASATTPRLPDAPAGLAVVSVGLDSIRIAWTDVADNETGYEVGRREAGDPGFSTLGTFPAGTTSSLDTGLSSGATYEYRVRALNEYGASEWTPELSVTTGRLPAAPSSLALASTGLFSLGISWSDVADNETGYEVERTEAGGADFLPLVSLPAGSTSHADLGLVSGGAYAYRVRATNEFGASAWSETLVATTGRLPADPSDPVAVAVGLSSVEIAWTDLADNETAYEVERRGPGETGFSPLVALPGGSASHLDFGLVSGSAYEYRVRAVNEFGTSGWSGTLAVTIGRLPATPAGLRVASADIDTIGLAWTDVADNETGYELERRASGDPQFSPLESLPAGAVAYVDDGLPAGATYDYRLRAVNEFGTSDWSDTLSATTGRLPEAPAALEVAAVDVESIEIAWTDVAENETGYEVERKGPGEAGFTRIAVLPAGAESFADAGLVPASPYEYRVRAVNELGASGYAGPVVAETLHPDPRIASIDPIEGPSSGGTDVTITGENFFGEPTVRFGDEPASGVVVESLTRIRCTTPAGVRGEAAVTVETSRGSVALEDAFTYYDVYRRGDSNGDSRVDISDPIATLNWLFLGGEEPVCSDVADANHDGKTDLSDAVFVLSFLFTNGDPILPEESRCY